MDKEAFLKIAKYPLVKFSDMSTEMRDEAIDISISAVEKNPKNMEKATQTIKENMDRKFGSPWNVICGEGVGDLVRDLLRGQARAARLRGRYQGGAGVEGVIDGGAWRAAREARGTGGGWGRGRG